MAGWCRLWIPNFGLIAKPLYAAVKGPEGFLEWTPECRKNFDEIKRKRMEASALGLLNLRTVFVPHAVSSLLENKGHHWISPSRVAKYQVVLLEQDDVVISLTSALNPATLLISEKMMEILLKKLHQETHSGADALVLIAKRHLIGPRMQSLVDIIVKIVQYLLRQ
ncbi:hypothetical protein QYF61_004489 [Mycteria americana]|uniref:Uncharacterized protein n=1 Tax=Mycteria americana TaxID=33587 RepID=A0AAN7RVN8_MYCAM|nr:hypothetical protein QYF61_004489 [Mycteria americana]